MPPSQRRIQPNGGRNSSRFSAGPHHCVGETLAVYEMLVHVSKVARRYRLVHEPREPIEFEALIKALGNGTAYVNVHTATFPSGEIRASVRRVSP